MLKENCEEFFSTNGVIPDSIYIIHECFIQKKHWGVKQSEKDDLDFSVLIERIKKIIAEKVEKDLTAIASKRQVDFRELENKGADPELNEMSCLNSEVTGDVLDLFHAIQFSVNYEDIFSESEDVPLVIMQDKYNFDEYGRFLINLKPKDTANDRSKYFKLAQYQKIAFIILNIISAIQSELDLRSFFRKHEKVDEYKEYFSMNHQFPPYIFCYFGKDTDQSPNKIVAEHYESFYHWFNILDTNIYQTLEKKYEEMDEEDLAVRDADLLFVAQNSAMWYVSMKRYNFKADMIAEFVLNGEDVEIPSLLKEYKIMKQGMFKNELTFMRVPLDVRAIGFALRLLGNFIESLQDECLQKKMDLKELDIRRNRYRKFRSKIQEIHYGLTIGDPNDFERDHIIDRMMKIYKIDSLYEKITRNFDGLEQIANDLVEEQEEDLREERQQEQEKAEKRQEKTFNMFTLVLSFSIIFEIINNLSFISDELKPTVLNWISIAVIVAMIIIVGIIIASRRSPPKANKKPHSTEATKK